MEESVIKKFAKYVSLNILGMLGLSFYILADTYFVSKALGSIGIASLNLSISIYSVIYGLGLMIGIGGATRFSILRVQNKKEKANIVFSNAVKFGLMLGISLVSIGIFGSKYLALALGADTITLPLTQIYLTTILCFSPFLIFNNMILAFIRNDNNPKLSMIAMLVASFSNIILDYIFMFPLNMGIFGAAFATGLAPIISIVILSFHFTSKYSNIKFVKSKFDIVIVGDIFSLGLSSLIIEVSSAIVLITFNIVILDIEGNLGVAAYAIVANLALVVIAIFTGIGQGAQPLISEYFGQGNFNMIKKIRRYALTTSFIIAFVIYSLTMIFSDSIIQIFNSENNIVLAQIAETGLKIYFFGFFFAGLNIVIIMFLSATENIKDALSISILRGVIIIVPMVIILSRFWNMIGVWLAFVITELIVTIIGVNLERSRNKSIIIDQEN